jgi:hypothetical protein
MRSSIKLTPHKAHLSYVTKTLGKSELVTMSRLVVHKKNEDKELDLNFIERKKIK